MNIIKLGRLIAPLLLAAALSPTAIAAPIMQEVTYTWHTISATGSEQPTATFDATLSSVQAGKISASDISNIQFSFPSLSFNNAAVSTFGFDFAAFVDSNTGAPVFNDFQQGLALLAFVGSSVNDMTTFLSITFGNPANGAVKDQYNSLKNGISYSFGSSGFWTAAFPVVTPEPPVDVPEPATFALVGLGLAGLAFGRRRKA